MARRILSADSALTPQTQTSLGPSRTPEVRGGFLQEIQSRWQQMQTLGLDQVVFDWDDRNALMQEISWVNEAREKLDEAYLKVAPSMLRIVLTVKAHEPDPADQRAFLANHLDWDLKRVSELCITADSYALLDPERRQHGEAEIRRYGWSSALKLAYVREPLDRDEIWNNARGEKPRASYRAVLEELRRFRERKQIGPPLPERLIGERLFAAKKGFDHLEEMAPDLGNQGALSEALNTVVQVQRDLNQLRKVLRDRMKSLDTEGMAART